MGVLIPFLFFSLFNVSIIVLSKKKFGFTIPFSFILCSLFLFVFGLFGNLKFGYYFLWLICFLVIIYIFFLFIKDKNKFNNLLNLILTPGFIVFTILFIYVCYYHRNTTFKIWDEFSHWGPMVKQMFLSNKFYCITSANVQHKNYPPFVQLFELLWCYLCNGFQQNYIYRGLFSFGISFFLPLFEIDSYKKSLKTKIILLIFTLLLVIMNISINYLDMDNIYSAIYLDSFPSLAAAFGLYISLKFNYDNKLDYLFLSLSLLIILMSKQIGIIFVFIILLCVLVKKIDTFTANKMNCMFFAISILFPFVINAIWSFVVNSYHVPKDFTLSSISISSLFNILFRGIGADYQINCLHNFLSFIINNSLLDTIHLSYIYYTLLLSIVICLLIIPKIKKEKSYISLLIPLILFVGAIGYAFCILTMYLFAFSADEAVNLASCGRYLNTYSLFLSSTIVYLIAYLFETAEKTFVYVAASTSIVFYFLLSHSHLVTLIPSKNNNSYKNQYEIKELYDQIDAFSLQENEKVAIITQWTEENWTLQLYTDFDYLNNEFLVLSLDTMENNYSNFEELVSQYDYVYLYSTNETFYNNYWKVNQTEYLFNNRLYKNNNLNFELVPWTPSNG